ncbi:peptidoglycan D,D-transpeptidase FtsI family protein [Anabaenopsis elenkinii]|uniref:Penicillin-binding protein 2 n=1 Tax=Anabaenopsis elenkinii CCIBt3563 TaxID=2779889 RepID=A0A7S6RFV4_9CYAN|nr:penicillin-binding protein 2 [Anabaenopsis elenkinii]QOV22722.1 penicillin-binding protein 2 [Anabaenopsis elenkinii CCIBt3563]
MQKSPDKSKLRNFQNPAFRRGGKPSILAGLMQRFRFNSHPQDEISNTRSRLFVVWGILMTAGLGLVINLYQLQIIQGGRLTQRARNQQMVNLRPFVPRRLVVDRTNSVLAIDRPVYTLYAHPKLFSKSNKQIAEQLAPILDQPSAELAKTFANRRSGITLASGLPEVSAGRVRSLRLNGLELIQQYSRYYPQNNLVAEVVGYVNLDRRGQAGVEYSQENLLERSPKTARLSRTGNGRLLPIHAPEGFLNFDDLRLRLTIDSRLQRIARTALEKQIEKFKAKRGAVIVMDASDGSLLALTSYPTYNPNEYSSADISLFRNWTVADLYEPGSTFKPLNVAIALENGVIKADDVFNDPGSIQIGKHTIRNAGHKTYGNINIAQILQTSSNIGMVRIIQRMQSQVYYNWLERLGLGERLNTDLPFEVSGQLKGLRQFLSSPIEAATTSFGQGFSLTPLQLVQMHGALANGGKLVTPHVVQGLVDSKGQMHYAPDLPTTRQIFSATTTQKVVEMMETVVSEGTGNAAKIPGYRIGGKTGTSQKASPDGGYLPNARITSFVSILPVESPRYVVFAVVDEPQGTNAYGSTVAAPIVKAVIQGLISIEGIPPSQSTK